MMKEASSFFVTVVGLLALCCGYIYSQGGSPFTLAGGHLSTSQPPAPGDYHALARQDAIDNGISADLFERQINQESGFNPNARGGDGEIGIAQFEPDTARGLGIDPWNAEQSLQGAARLMASYSAKYGDYSKALSAYNYGSTGTDSALTRCGSAWKTCIPSETRTYIHAIMGEN